MKIYNISEIPEGLRVPSYEEVLLSGYTDGYEDGYNTYPCYRKMYFTIEAYENGVIPNLSNGFFYSRNGGEWEQYLGGGFSVSAGDVIQFKAETTRIYNDFQGMQFRCAAYGNTMSLLYGDNFVGRTDLPHGQYYSITGLFGNCTGLFDASELVLPATELEYSCYANMFSGCVNLTSIPKLPATTLAEACYQGMFRGCTSLTAVPELPVMELAPMCYETMFENCTALETAPELPATELVERCYLAMFRGCTSLVNAPELPATTLGSRCYVAMFYGCTSLVVAPDLPGEVLSDFCYYEMFKGCTSLTGAPVICATTLAENACCKSMFEGCTSLVNAPAVLPATSLTRGCYEQMFNGCTSLENSPVLPATVLANNCYQSMFSDCTSLQSAPSLPAASLCEGCYYSMFRGCTSLQSAPELPATTLADYCYNGMFFDCSSLETAPELLADILVDGCYQAMFGFCSSLMYIKCLATYIDAPECTAGWVNGLPGEGIFEKACVDWDNKGYGSGIPGGWTVIDNCPHYEDMYFTVEALSDSQGTIPRGVRWRMNDGDWNASADTDTMVSMVFGDKIEMSRVGNHAQNLFMNKTMPLYKVYGNIMSLIYGDEFIGQDTIPYVEGDGIGFISCFSGQSLLVSAENLVLPAMNLVHGCYFFMFWGCASLTEAPKLPATALTENCYTGMFNGCTALSSGPELPATSLAYRCYYFMFNSCTNLINAPALPATTLAQDCYQGMFARCTSLETAPELPASATTSGCYANMFNGCTSLNEIKCLATSISDWRDTNTWTYGVSQNGIFYCKQRGIWAEDSPYGIPEGWTIIEL